MHTDSRKSHRSNLPALRWHAVALAAVAAAISVCVAAGWGRQAPSAVAVVEPHQAPSWLQQQLPAAVLPLTALAP